MPTAASVENEPICPLISRSPGHQGSDATSQFRIIARHFEGSQRPLCVPLDIQRALDTIVKYLENDGSCDHNIAPRLGTNPVSSVSPTLNQPQAGHSKCVVTKNVQINRVTQLDLLYTYSAGATVEYPETSSTGLVGHLFTLDPKNWTNPALNFAYSRGAPSGVSPLSKKVTCAVLIDEDGEKVLCRELHSTCQGCKVCQYADPEIALKPHCSASREVLIAQLKIDKLHDVSLDRLLFEKTLAYFGALMKQGCAAPPFEKTVYSLREASQRQVQHDQIKKATRGHEQKATCNGRLLLEEGESGNAFIRCEHYNRAQTRDHFIDYDAGKGHYNIQYLRALFSNSKDEILSLENEAAKNGYGPRSPCKVISNISTTRVMCPLYHRDSDGKLVLSEMRRTPCTSKYRIFEPLEDFRSGCPKILVVCRGEHSHPFPIPSKTPPEIREEIFHIFDSLQYDLPDLTPRRLLRHPITMSYLRKRLPNVQNPTLLDLHSSLGNRDHLRAYISQAQEKAYPKGTDWEGVLEMKSHQDSDPNAIPYIRVAQEFILCEKGRAHDDSDDDGDNNDVPFRVIICMSPESSGRLLAARFIQSDIGFKRIIGFEEFELGGLDLGSRTSIVYCHIYLNRQTAIAHKYIFEKIDELVKIDTGSSLRWRHIHASTLDDLSTGILQLAADQHGGQAKGFGLYLSQVAQSQASGRKDIHETNHLITDLSPYDHLRQIFRLCSVHVMRNIQSCAVSDSVKNKMRSLVCMEHHEWENTLEKIKIEGGKAGADWVEDKIRSKFAFPGMCWMKSLIPRKVWQVGDPNSNIIEGLHADVNREGVSCTLLGGLMKGQNYDTFKLKTLKTFEDTGVRPSYQRGYVSETAIRGLRRKARNQHNAWNSQDTKIQMQNKRLAGAHLAMQKAEVRYVNFLSQDSQLSAGTTLEKAKKSWVRAQASYGKALSASSKLVGTGSGKVAILLPRGFQILKE